MCSYPASNRAETFIAHAEDKLHQLDHCSNAIRGDRDKKFYRLPDLQFRETTRPGRYDRLLFRMSQHSIVLFADDLCRGYREADGITVADNLGTSHLENSTCTMRDTNRRR